MANDTANSIISGAATALGNYAVGVAANRRQFKYQQKAMEQQQAYNKELWDYQNAYNTPSRQMERLQAAGLNPHLVYGSGAAAAGNAGPISPTEVPTQQATHAEIPDVFMRRLVVRQMDQQYAATAQNIENAKIKAALDESKTALQNLGIMRESLRAKNYKDLAEAEKTTAQFVALRSGALYANEKSKGNLMDQMHSFRQEANKLTLSTMELDKEFKQNRNALARLGVYSSDNALLRILITSANRQGIDLSELLQKPMEAIKYLIDLAK